MIKCLKKLIKNDIEKINNKELNKILVAHLINFMTMVYILQLT